jgi:hypothetical protein
MARSKDLAWDAHYASIARRAGLRNPWKALREARAAGIGPALALAMIEQESGGANVFGHDKTIFVGAGEVTREKYLAYKRQRGVRGEGGMQGVGPMQLTFWSTQDTADMMGGCWKPRINCRVGLRTLAFNIHAHGLRSGIMHYNGSGPKAEQYMRSVLARRAKWHKRLFG